MPATKKQPAPAQAPSIVDVAAKANALLAEELQSGVPLSQDTLAAFAQLAQVAKVFETMQKAIKEHAAGWKDKITEAYQPGALVLHVTQTSKVSPKWKEEAIEVARRLSEAQGTPWNEAAYVQQVGAKTTPSVSVSISVSAVSG
jgi:hypothetical protein